MIPTETRDERDAGDFDGAPLPLIPDGKLKCIPEDEYARLCAADAERARLRSAIAGMRLQHRYDCRGARYTLPEDREYMRSACDCGAAMQDDKIDAALSAQDGGGTKPKGGERE